MGDLLPLCTDYKYDALYRVIEVKTPNEKHIYYTYDGLGRQSSRTTPDAGEVKYKYDKNDNLRFSQDNNQANKPTERPPARYLSYRGYDGLNRILYLCDAYNESELVLWSNLNPDNTYNFDSYSSTPNNFLVINVYDTLTNYPANAGTLFTGSHVPVDYYTSSPFNTNNTKGTLCAAAYRTLGTDEWSYKYYRYDARSRVIKMWNYIAGLGWKITKYEYNSQNQLTKLEYQSESDTDYKRCIYNYDFAGRMHSVSTEESGQPPDYNYVFAQYKYNENSQTDSLLLNNTNVTASYAFNNRNWITSCTNNYSLFSYSLDYLANGNVNSQSISGTYKSNFSNTKEIRSGFTYDKSNRLKQILKYNSKYFDLTGDYSYDSDGNFTSLTRSYNSDNFSYDYYSGTNRLKKITGSADQYTYDYNGNQTNDYINNNTGIKYDHRNLITEFTRQDLTQDPPVTDITRYKYDEAGNRTRKTIYRSNDSNPPPLPEENEDLPSGWTITKDEYYSRDASGKEIAVYQSYTLDYWNVWGSNNEGRIKPTGMKYFYLKDHLGSIRAVINQNNVLVQAQDYDPWGHIARTWDSTSTNYKFTGKQRDAETGYDYFGARYYDARIARWGGIEPLLEKYFSYSPYQYGLLNPMKLADEGGLLPRITTQGNLTIVNYTFYYVRESNDKTYGLNNDQIDALSEIKYSMESWSIAENTQVSVNFLEAKNMNMNQMQSNFKGQYDNFVLNPTGQVLGELDEPGIGVATANVEKGDIHDILYISSDLKYFDDSGAHELAHLFGLKHSDARKVYVDNPKSNTSLIPANSIAGPRLSPNGDKYYRAKVSIEDWKSVFELNRRGLFSNINKFHN